MKFHLRFIALIGVIVPQRLRADWRQEWEAELRYRELMLADWAKLNWRSKFDLLWRSLGAFSDALWLQHLRWEDEMIQDLRFGLRMLFRHKAFSCVAVLTLAVGLGATTAIFSIVYAAVLRPLPFPESERLVSIWTNGPNLVSGRAPLAAAIHRDFREQNTLFEDIALLRDVANFNLTGEGEPERLLGARIAANLFPVLRVHPAMGRGFTEEEDEIDHDQVVILSHGLWQRKFGGDSNIIGKTILLASIPHTVVGVMGPEFQYPTREFQIWKPLTINPADFQTRTGNAHLAVARLKPGVTIEQAQAEINTITERMAEQYPNSDKDVWFRVTSLREDIGQPARTPLFVLLGAVLGLLLIACSNLTNLLLARSLARSRETAVRSALGATRWRLIRQSAVEMFPILGIGSLTGVALANWGVKLMVPSLPATLPRVEEIQVNAPVLLFSGCVLGLTAALVLAWPTIRATRIDLVADLREDARTAAGSARKANMRDFLVVGQVAITVILLVGAGLLIRTFSQLKAVNPGFRSEGVLSLHLAIPRARYTDDRQVAAFCQRVLERVQVLPGVERAGMIDRLPLSGQTNTWSIEFEASVPPLIRVDNVAARTATPDYFSTMGIRLMEGRFFTERDQEKATQVAIVDDQVAKTFWPGASAVGKRLRAVGRENAWTEIVGVVSHIRHDNLDSDPGPQIYWNYLQRARDRMALVVRSQSANLLPRDILDAIWSVDPEQPVYAVRPMSEVLDRSLALRWFNTVILSAFAAASLFLAVLGIYGVVSWNARQRTREVGIRIALGARRRDVETMVLSHGMKLAGMGIGLGLAGAALATRFIHSLLVGVSDFDPVTFVAIPVLLAGAALLACWLPARRASRVDPMVALRHE